MFKSRHHLQLKSLIPRFVCTYLDKMAAGFGAMWKWLKEDVQIGAAGCFFRCCDAESADFQ